MKTDQTKQNKTKSDQTNPLYFEIPLSKSETLAMFTVFLNEKRGMQVTAVSGSFKKGRLYIGVLPEGLK